MNFISKTRAGRVAKRLLVASLIIIAWGLLAGSDPLFVFGTTSTSCCLIYILMRFIAIAK